MQKKLTEQDVTTHGGARNRYQRKRTGRRTDAEPCMTRRTEKGSRSEVLQDALGAFHEQREPPQNPATEAMEQKMQRTNKREKPEIGSAALRPLSAR